MKVKIPLDKLIIDNSEDGVIKYQWFVMGFDKPIIEDEAWVGKGTLTFEGMPQSFTFESDTINVLDPGLIGIIEARK